MIRRFLRNGIVIAFLYVTVAAYLMTMFRLWLPPRGPVHWAYGMMAPYQGDTSWNADFVYEGQH